MRNWKRAEAAAAIFGFGLSESNLEVAKYWLSLWDGDRPPTRRSFNPMRIAKQVPALAMFEVRVGESVGCKLAGGHYRLALGTEITGKDLLALTPKLQRRERIRTVSEIAEGAVMRANRSVFGGDGAIDITEELYLPFADPSESGARRYLMHSDWKPRSGEYFVAGECHADTSIPANRAIAPIKATEGV